jgi:hypothetical protein
MAGYVFSGTVCTFWVRRTHSPTHSYGFRWKGTNNGCGLETSGFQKIWLREITVKVPLEVFTLPHLFRPDNSGHLCHQNPNFSGENEGFCPVIVRSQFRSFSGRTICPPDFPGGQSMDSPPEMTRNDDWNDIPWIPVGFRLDSGQILQSTLLTNIGEKNNILGN